MATPNNSHSKASCTSSGFESLSTGWEVSIWGIPTDNAHRAKHGSHVPLWAELKDSNTAWRRKMASNMRKVISCFAFMPFLTLLIFASAQAQDAEHPARQLLIPQSHLSDRQSTIAAELGASELFRMAPASVGSILGSGERIILSSVQQVSNNDPDSFLALVTIYNYDRHETIRRLVDLNRREVVSEKVSKGGSAPLAEVEKLAAEALIRNNARIAAWPSLNDMEDVELEFLLASTPNREDPLYGQRAAAVIFKTSRGYPQTIPKVFVSLTNARVIILE